MTVLQEMINYITAFSMLLAIGFFGLNYLTKGFIWAYLRVKASQGKKLLTRIHTPSDIYWRPGRFHEGFYKFKDRSGVHKSIPIGDIEFQEFVHHTMGVGEVEVNEEGNKIVSKDTIDWEKELIEAAEQISAAITEVEDSQDLDDKQKEEALVNLQKDYETIQEQLRAATTHKLARSDFKIVKLENVDPGRLDSVVLRIKNRPQSMTKKEQFIWLLRIGTAVMAGYSIYLLFKVINILTEIQQISGNV